MGDLLTLQKFLKIFLYSDRLSAQNLCHGKRVPTKEVRFQYQREWNLTREEQLRNQLRHIRENRKKLSRIAYNCQKAADRRIYNKDYLAKAEHFRSLWYQKLQEENEMKTHIRELKETRKEQERLHRTRERER